MTSLSKQHIVPLVKPVAIVFLLLLFWNLGLSTARGTETALEALQADVTRYNLRWTPGETALSHLSSEEKQRRAGGLKTPPERIDPDQIWQKPERDRAIGGYPPSYNLWDSGMITPVRDQESCGSCWAFAAVANLEALLSQAGQGGQDLSEQVVLNFAAPVRAADGIWITPLIFYKAPARRLKAAFRTGDQTSLPILRQLRTSPNGNAVRSIRPTSQAIIMII